MTGFRAQARSLKVQYLIQTRSLARCKEPEIKKGENRDVGSLGIKPRRQCRPTVSQNPPFEAKVPKQTKSPPGLPHMSIWKAARKEAALIQHEEDFLLNKRITIFSRKGIRNWRVPSLMPAVGVFAMNHLPKENVEQARMILTRWAGSNLSSSSLPHDSNTAGCLLLSVHPTSQGRLLRRFFKL